VLAAWLCICLWYVVRGVPGRVPGRLAQPGTLMGSIVRCLAKCDAGGRYMLRLGVPKIVGGASMSDEGGVLVLLAYIIRTLIRRVGTRYLPREEEM